VGRETSRSTYAAEKRNLAEAIPELREIVNGHDDVLAEAAGITAGSLYAHVGHELIAAGMLIAPGGRNGKSPCGQLAPPSGPLPSPECPIPWTPFWTPLVDARCAGPKRQRIQEAKGLRGSGFHGGGQRLGPAGLQRGWPLVTPPQLEPARAAEGTRRVPHDYHSRLRADAATTADGALEFSRQRAAPVASRKASTAMIRRFSSFSSMMPSFWNIEPMCFSTARSLI
jgi:hypothetical protein